ncbi:MAG: ABC transporter ATP-binding protein [Acidobacteriota bacterium]
MSVGVEARDLKKVYRSAPRSSGPQNTWTGRPTRRKPRRKVEVVALDGLNLEVETGRILGLLGPNGAGKSTTIGILTTRIRPSSGQALIGGFDVWNESLAVKPLIGIVPQSPNLDFSLTAREILLFHGAYFGLSAGERRRRAEDLLRRFQLSGRADQMANGFSGGMMQRLSIARALMHRPSVLFLDEPSAGLDPQSRLLLWEIIREIHEQGTTILLTTHNMEEADRLCQQVAIIDHGQIIAQGTPEALKSSVPGGFLLRLRFDSKVSGLTPALADLAEIRDVREVEETGLDVYADRGGELLPRIWEEATRLGLNLNDIHIAEPSLENLFLHHTGRSLRE